MSLKMPHPAAPDRAHRAANSKELPCTFDCQNSEAVDGHQTGPAFNRPAALVRGAEWLALAISEKRDLAFAIDGPRAFDCPKTSIAFHEAAHCVVGALQGNHPSKASIWPIIELGRVWIGCTYGLPKWRVDSTTLAEDDLYRAESELAGVVSEWLFDPDFRLASSIDEIARAQGIVLTAATKLRRDVQQLWLETFVSVATILRANERVVRDIATELMNQRSVKASRLTYLLRSIDGPAPNQP
jgi:hypothetical protein